MHRLLPVLLLAAPALSAEVALRDHAESAGPVVLVGDVAAVTGAGADAVRAVPVTPMRPSGVRVTADEVRRRLASAGLWDAETRLTGAARCAVRAVARKTAAPPPAGVSPYQRRQAARKLEALVADRLSDAFPDRAFGVAVALADEHVAAVLSATRTRLSGGDADLTRPQSLTLHSTPPVPFTATLTETPAVVVAAATLPRGTVLRESHLRLAAAGEEGLTDVTPLLGQQLQRPLAAGRPLAGRDVKPVQLVRNGAVVTVTVELPGVRVARQMKSRDAGGLGETIQCVSLDGRKVLAATVTGPNAASVGPPAAAPASLADETGTVTFRATEDRATEDRPTTGPPGGIR